MLEVYFKGFSVKICSSSSFEMVCPNELIFTLIELFVGLIALLYSVDYRRHITCAAV